VNHHDIIIVVPEDNLNWLLIDQMRTKAFSNIDVAIVFETSKAKMLQKYCDQLNISSYDCLAKKKSRVLRGLKLSRLVRTTKASSVIVHSYPLGYLVVIMRLLNPKVTTVFVRHHNENHHLLNNKKSILLDKLYIMFASHVVAVSHTVRTTILRECQGASRKVSVIYNGFDIERFRELRTRKITSSQDKYFKILAIGRLDWQKDYPLMLEILRKYRLEVAEIDIEVYGEGKDGYKDKLETLAKHNSVSHAITFNGWNPKILEVMSNSSVILHTAIDEACPLVIIEALLLGIPIVAIGNGGTKEILSTFGLDLNHSISDMICSLWKVQFNYTEAKRRANSLISKAEDLFDAERSALEYLQIPNIR